MYDIEERKQYVSNISKLIVNLFTQAIKYEYVDEFITALTTSTDVIIKCLDEKEN